MAEEKPDLFVVSVGSRIPEFWVDQPALWFVQFEAVVTPQKQSDENRYQLLVAKLGKNVLQQVTDIVTSPPATDKYKTLKDRLLSVYEESENQRIQKLINSMQLGDQKPSQLLRRMQGLAGSRVTNDTLTVLWQNHLPSAVRAVLAASELTDMAKLAAVADKVWESTQVQSSGVAEVSGSSSGSLADQIAKLSLEVAAIRKGGYQQGGRERSRSRSKAARNRSSSRGQGRTSKDPDWLCFYHFRFKEKATKCVQPCSWKGDKPGN